MPRLERNENRKNLTAASRTGAHGRRIDVEFQDLLEAVPDSIVVTKPLGEIVFVNAQAENMFGYSRQELLGRKIGILGLHLRNDHPDDRKRLSQASRVLVFGKPRTFRVVHRGGQSLPVEIQTSRLRIENGMLTVTSIRDVTARADVQDDLQRAKVEAQARAAELSAIFDAAPGMTLIARDPDCRVMTGGRVAYHLLRLPYGTNLSKSAPEGEKPANFRVYKNGRELAPKELPVQRAAATGQEVRDSELRIVFANGDSLDFLGNAAPLLNDDGTIRGAVGVFVDITERKSAARATRELYARMLRLQDNERRRIARDLHDSVGQNLTGLVLSLGVLRRTAARLDLKSRKTLAEGLVSARAAAREVRTLSRLLHPPLLHEFGLAEAIRTYVRGFSERSNIKVDTHLPSRRRRFDKELETTLFRVVQEALTNVYRHSGSKRAIIRLEATHAHLVLEIRDFGRGIRASMAAKKSTRAKAVGVGLPGIRERLQYFDGELEVQSNQQGTLLRALIPSSRVKKR
jgi:PAS domain S-box-containing protein